jgi:hypothetical protein
LRFLCPLAANLFTASGLELKHRFFAVLTGLTGLLINTQLQLGVCLPASEPTVSTVSSISHIGAAAKETAEAVETPLARRTPN